MAADVPHTGRAGVAHGNAPGLQLHPASQAPAASSQPHPHLPSQVESSVTPEAKRARADELFGPPPRLH
eukprot:5430345-Karenia_brevis.AAC.1